MRLDTVCAHAAVLAMATLAGCTGQIGELPSGAAANVTNAGMKA